MLAVKEATVQNSGNLPDIPLLLLIGIVVSFLPIIAMLCTSYLKIVVVLGIVRNAIGVQQVPPNMVLGGMAMILTAFIMAPVFLEIKSNISKSSDFSAEKVTSKGIMQIASAAKDPLVKFLQKHTPEKDIKLFSEAAKGVWGPAAAELEDPASLLTLVPAFTVSELSKAFQIGFLLYLLFIAIDLIIANLLQALGMTMLSPTPVAIPFKLLIFVAFDGWQQLILALVMSYR